MRIWLSLALWLAACLSAQAQSSPPVGTCIGGNCTAGAPVPKTESRPPSGRGFAQEAAIFGAVSAGLLLGGSIAIAAVDDPASERVTRGVFLGYAAVAVPVVAIGSFSTRSRIKLKGHPRLRFLGWTSYAGTLANGITQWVGAFREWDLHWGFTVGLGAIAMMAILPHSFDAFVAGRAARQRGFVRLLPAPNGLAVRF